MVTGFSGSGKSTTALWLFLKFPPPRVVIDPGNSALFDLPQFFTTSDPTGASWGDHVNIRFVPLDPGDQAIYDRLYSTVRSFVQPPPGIAPRWPCVAVLADEAETCLPDNARGAGPAMVFSGRKWPSAHLATATRPRKISTSTRANLTHGVIYPLYLADDRKTIADDLGIPLRVLEEAMAALPVPVENVSNERGFLFWTASTRSLLPVLC
ncbi:MAG TPA: hypothetical protein VFN61_04480 [Acidimicrobiales bacterium]|nr:hypothetical protein [Acidimicrobiales bacterium]